MLSLIPKFSLWPIARPLKTQKGFTTIAVGANGLIARTTDGVTWTEPASGVTTELHMAAYGGGVWMIVGASSTILKSTDDGVTWTKLTVSTDILTNVPMVQASIVYDAGRFLVITNNRMCIYTTDNGATWTRINASSMHTNYFKRRARRWDADGKIYQNGGASGAGYTVFNWNGTGYVAVNENAVSGSTYIVQSAIAGSATTLASLQQGASINRKKDGVWTKTRNGGSNEDMVDGGMSYNANSNAFYAVGNTSSGPTIFFGVDGDNWQTLPNTTTMFGGAGQKLSDISSYDKNSFIVGGTKIFTSTDWTTWGLAYTAGSAFNTVSTRERVINTIGDAYRWRLVSFKDNEHIDDVTEKFMTSWSTMPTLANQRMRTTSDGQGLYEDDMVLFNGTEDFTVGITLTPATQLAANVGKDLHIFSGDAQGGRGTWYCNWATNFQNFLFRFYKTDGTQVAVIPSGVLTLAANVDFHIELGRKNGVLYIFYNGIKQTINAIDTGASQTQQAAVKGLSLGMTGSSNGFNGWRRNFYIDRGICRHTENFTPDLSPMEHVRTVYSDEDAAAIRCQFDMRRDSNHNVANGRLVNLLGYTTSYVRRGRLYFGGTQSATGNCHQIPMEPWGAGDFTLETSLLVTATGTNGCILLAEWYYGTASDDRNRWAFSIGNDRKVYFGIAANTAGSSATYVISNLALTTGLSYRIIVERVNGVVTIYVLDAYTGVLLDTKAGTIATPIRGAMPHTISNSSAAGNFWSGTGQMWDIRIADKAMYNGKPTLLNGFPAFPDRRYSDADQANVVAQFNGSNPIEQISSAYVAVSGGALVINNQLLIPNGGGFQFSKTTPPFMAADFTIECRMLFNTIAAYPCSVIGQFLNSRSDNSWHFRIMNGHIGAVLSKTGAALTDLVVLESTITVVAGVEYYVVVERVGSTITLYVDGVPSATATYAGDFGQSPTAIQRGDISSYAGVLRDLRCSKVSQYKGNVPKFPQYPRVRKPKPHITLGFHQGGVGTLYGYMENSDYTSQVGWISLGSCSQKLWQIGGIVRRIKGLFIDRNNYMIIGWEVTNITPTPDIPLWTNTLEINGTQFGNLSGQPYSGFTTPLAAMGTGTSVYWSGAASYWGTLQEGRMVSFDFV